MDQSAKMGRLAEARYFTPRARRPGSRGAPLFIEELTRTVLESGLLRDEGGRWVLNGPLPPLAIPKTLRDSLEARLDRLSLAKEIAQLGATLGRDFSYELLRLARRARRRSSDCLSLC